MTRVDAIAVNKKWLNVCLILTEYLWICCQNFLKTTKTYICFFRTQTRLSCPGFCYTGFESLCFCRLAILLNFRGKEELNSKEEQRAFLNLAKKLRLPSHPKLHIPSIINTRKRMLSTAIWADNWAFFWQICLYIK